MAIVCSGCASSDWVCCAPGTEAEPRLQANLCILRPAPEVSLWAWCLSCWLAAHPRQVRPA